MSNVREAKVLSGIYLHDIIVFVLAIRLAVGQQTLNLLAQVRILDRQPVILGNKITATS